MYNRATLIGTLGKKPEIKELNGKRVANLSLATWESRQNQEGEWVKDTTWHTVTVWNNAVKAIETAEQGDLILVDGKINVRNYKGETNEIHKVVSVVGIAKILRRKNTQQQQDMPTGGKYAENMPQGGGYTASRNEDINDDLVF